MKKIIFTRRKHGYKARLQSLPNNGMLLHAAPARTPRLTTQVTFESSSQSYFWLTDRGRSRLLKH